ncbi:MAG TPA: metal-binding protein, partial [Methanobacteriaceae archaeon]|nr:metal-binding protein [Methanobacteriaceae archaeon]
MKKHGIIVLVAVMAVLLCGAVSAADSSTAEVEGLSEVNAPAEAVDPILWVTVNYEYASDDINPDIEVKDSHNAIVQYDKSPYSRNLYKLNFTYPGVTNGTLFKVTVNAPGYTTQTQNVAVNQAGSDPEFYGNAVFNMEATSNYQLGREVTKKADQLLNFATA